MDPNPYKSPNVRSSTRLTSRFWPIAAYSTVWLFFFLIPALTVVLSFVLPQIFALTERPSGNTIFSRISLCIGVRADIVLPISFIGCAVVGALLPIPSGWRIAIVISWFPLILFVELLAIILGIQWATGYVCT